MARRGSHHLRHHQNFPSRTDSTVYLLATYYIFSTILRVNWRQQSDLKFSNINRHLLLDGGQLTFPYLYGKSRCTFLKLSLRGQNNGRILHHNGRRYWRYLRAEVSGLNIAIHPHVEHTVGLIKGYMMRWGLPTLYIKVYVTRWQQMPEQNKGYVTRWRILPEHAGYMTRWQALPEHTGGYVTRWHRWKALCCLRVDTDGWVRVVTAITSLPPSRVFSAHILTPPVPPQPTQPVSCRRQRCTVVHVLTCSEGLSSTFLTRVIHQKQ